MSVLCIVFSVLLVTAIFSMADMALRAQKSYFIKTNGEYHASVILCDTTLPDGSGLDLLHSQRHLAERYGALVDSTNLRDDLSRTELVKRVLQNPDMVTYRFRGYSYYNLDVTAKKTAMEANPAYIHRKKILESREKNQQTFQNEILSLERKKSELATLNTQELLSQLDDETEKDF